MGSAIDGIVRLYTDMDPDTELYRIRKRSRPHEHDLITPMIEGFRGVTEGPKGESESERHARTEALLARWSGVLARLADNDGDAVSANLALAPGLRVAVEITKDRLAALRAHDSDAMRARPAAVAAIEDVIVFLEAAADRTSRGEHPHARTPLT